MKFSLQEPAARTVPVILSAAEVAAVILFHHRQIKRTARLAGEIALGLCKESHHITPVQKADALEECQTQSHAHEARAMELTQELKRAKAQPVYSPMHSAN